MKISVIVTTYNWPAALYRVLASLCNQSYDNFEVIVADDGSDRHTQTVVENFIRIAPMPIKHVWHEDQGFRAAKIRNKAVAQAQGDYLIFLDGDCIVQRHFVKRHAQLAKRKWFVAGNRILINQELTQRILTENLTPENWSLAKWFLARWHRQINRWLSLIHLPLGYLRDLSKHAWIGVKTCNLALWRSEFVLVNGFDEKFEGWGFEDSDLVLRLLRAQIYRRSGKSAMAVFHLWHKEASREQMLKNRRFLEDTLTSNHIQAHQGIDQYLS